MFQRLSGRAAGSLGSIGSPRQKRAAISPAVGGLSELGWGVRMSLPSYICIFTSICDVAAVTEAQSREHQYKMGMSARAASQTAQMHAGLEIRFVEAVCGTQQPYARLARWTSSVAPQHQQRTVQEPCREVLCLDPCAGSMDAASPAAAALLCLGAKLCQYKYGSIVNDSISIFGANST